MVTQLPTISSGPRKGLFLGLLAVSIFEALSLFVVTMLIKSFAIALAGDGSRELFYTIALSLTAVTILLALLHWWGISLSEQLGMHYSGELRLALLASASKASGQRRLRLGSTMARMMGDLSAVRDWVAGGIATAMVAPLTLSAGIAGLFIIDAGIAMWLCVALLLLSTLLLPWLYPSLMSRALLLRRLRGRLSARLGDLVVGVGSVARYGRLNLESKRLAKQNHALLRASVGRVRRLGVASAVAAGVVPAVICSIAWLQWYGHTFQLSGPGIWSSLLFSLSLIAVSLMGMVRVLDQHSSFVVARRRLLELLQNDTVGSQAMLSGDQTLPGEPLSLTLQNLQSQKIELTETLQAAPGDLVLLHGDPGSGKSFLLRSLALATLSPSDRVLLNGVSLTDIAACSFKKRVQWITPALPLMRGSVRHNLRYAARRADRHWYQQIIECCGLETLSGQIEQGGENLSASQATRMRLARALATKPGLLLIDDPLYFYDPSARAALNAARQLSPMTILVAAPAPSALNELFDFDHYWRLTMAASGDNTVHRLLENDTGTANNNVVIHAAQCSSAPTAATAGVSIVSLR